MPQTLLSDADLGIGTQSQPLRSDADQGIGQPSYFQSRQVAEAAPAPDPSQLSESELLDELDRQTSQAALSKNPSYDRLNQVQAEYNKRRAGMSPLEQAASVAKLTVTRAIPKGVGMAMGLIGKGAEALIGGIAGTGDTTQDVEKSVALGEPLPVEQAAEKLKPVPRFLAQTGLSMVEAAPKIAMLAAAPETLPWQMASSAALFGLDAQGKFHPKEAVIMGLMPGVGRLASEGVSRAIASGLESGTAAIKNRFGQKILDTLGGQAAYDAYLTIADSPDLVAEWKDDPKKAIAHVAKIVGGNLAWGLLHLPNFRGKVPSATEHFLNENGDKYAKAYEKVFGDALEIPNIEERRVAMEAAYKESLAPKGRAPTIFGNELPTPDYRAATPGPMVPIPPLEERPPNATANVGQQPQGANPELPRTEARAAVPENQVEIRGQEGQAANDSRSVVQGAGQAGPFEAQPGVEKPAPAVFRGVQQGVPKKGIADVELWNLTEDVPGHPKNSTVSRKTLEDLGYTVPPRPEPAAPAQAPPVVPQTVGSPVSAVPPDVLAEIEKQKTGTGPLTLTERIELNELKIVRLNRGKLGLVNQARLEWLESRDPKPAEPSAPLPPAQAAAVEAAKPALEGAPVGAEVSGFRKNANGRWYRIEGGLKNVPANKKQSAQLEEAHAAGPIPVDERTPNEILGKARQVKVTVPEGATQIRVTQQNGQRSTEHIGSVNASVNKSGKGGNPFIGVDISKIEAGFIGKDGKFKLIPGDVKVEDVGRIRRASLGQRESTKGITVDVGGQSMTLSPPEAVDTGMRRGLPAFHGTPHDVDRFRTEKIGTGEGAQVYGWGLYFAENEAVGKSYQRQFEETSEADAEIWAGGKRLWTVANDPTVPYLKAAQLVESVGKHKALDFSKAKYAELEKDYKANNLNENLASQTNFWAGVLESLEELPDGTTVKIKRGANLYTVDITAKPEELLDWDKPLSQQSEHVKAAMTRLGFDLESSRGWGYTGQELYDALSKRYGNVADENFPSWMRGERISSAKKASELLQSNGIPGIRYRDQGSRNASHFYSTEAMAKFAARTGDTVRSVPNGTWEVIRPQTSNFVIWDESKIKITHKNGESVTPEEFRRASLGSTTEIIPQGKPIQINTIADLRRVVADPKSNISAGHRRVLQGMDRLGLFDKYPGLRLEVADSIEGGWMGEHVAGPDRTGFARFLRSSESATPFHEFLHHIEGFLDAGDRAVIRELRLQKLAEQPPQLRDTLTPGMTSDEFVRAGLSRDVYHLSSDSEFFAWLMSERGLKAIDTPRATTFVGKVRELIQGLYKAIKNSLGLTAPEEALWQKIISRKNSYSPQEGIEFAKSERKLALPRTPEQRAQEKEFRKGPREMVDVGIAGAYGDPVRLIMGEADKLNLSPDARRLLGIPKMAEMFALGIGEQNSVFNYATAREWAKGKTPNEQWWVQQDALHSQGNVERNWQRIDTGFERAKAEVTSPAFQKRMAKLDQRELQMDNRAAQEKTWKNIIAVKVSEYTIALEKAKGDDAATQQLRSDLKQARDLLSRTQDIAIGMDQIVSKVWRNYWELGTDSKNGKTFFDLYESVRRGEGNPLVNPEERRLAQLSSEILAINRSLTTQLMWRERMRVEPDFAALVDNVGKAFAKRIQEDPAKAIQELVAKQGDKSVKADLARQAYLSLQKDVLAKIRNYSTFEEAKMAKDRVEQSEEWKQLVNQVNADAEALHIPYAQREQIRKGIFNEFRGLAVWLDPAGKVHTIDFGHDQADALKANEQLQGYLKSIQDWLFNPANENHPDQAYWQRQHDFVDAAYNTSGIFNPTAVQSGGFKFLRKSWGMPEFLFRQTKLAFMKITQLAVENWHRAYVISSQWAQAHQARIIRATFDSAKSHGVDLLGGGMAKHRIDVLNPLAWDYRHNVARRAGDVVNGVKLTSQDIAWLKMVGAAENELRRANKNLGAQGIMPQELLIDEWWSGTFAVRRSKEFGAEPGTTVSRVNAPRMKSLTEDFSKLDPADYDRQSDLLNQSLYRPWVRNWLRERSGDYSRISPFEALFKDLVAATDAGTADAIKPNANIIDEITDFINRNTDDTYDREGIRKGLLDDMGRELRQFYDQVYKPAPNEEATTVRIVRAGKDSSFTKGFAEDLSNSFAYDYGLTNTQEIRRVALASTDYHLQRMARAFGDAIDRYEGALRDLRRVKDDPGQLAAVRAKNRDLFQSGDDFRDFEDMEMHLSELKHFRDQLGIWSGDQGVHYEGLQTANRVINALAGLAISGPQTLSRIFVDSIFKAGMTLQSFERFQLLTYPKAIVSTVMSAFNIAVAGPVKFAARRVGLAKPLEKPMTDWIEEIYRNGKFMDQQYDYGLGAKFATWDHIVNNWTMPLTKGFGYNAKLSGNRLVALGQRGLARLLTAAETPLDIVKPVFPALGYAIHYDSVARLITWEMKGLEARARRTFDTYESLGQLGRFDFANPKSPQNALLPREIIPDGIMPTTIRQLSLVNEYFARGTDIRLNDQIIKFWAKLQPRKRPHCWISSGWAPWPALGCWIFTMPAQSIGHGECGRILSPECFIRFLVGRCNRHGRFSRCSASHLAIRWSARK